MMVLINTMVLLEACSYLMLLRCYQGVARLLAVLRRIQNWPNPKGNLTGMTCDSKKFNENTMSTGTSDDWLKQNKWLMLKRCHDANPQMPDPLHRKRTACCVYVESGSNPVCCVYLSVHLCVFTAPWSLQPVEVHQVRAASINRSAIPRAPRGMIAGELRVNTAALVRTHIFDQVWPIFQRCFPTNFLLWVVVVVVPALLFIVMIVGCATGRLSPPRHLYTLGNLACF